MLTALGQVGRRYREALLKQMADDLDKGGRYPQGVVAYAKVSGTAQQLGTDYAILAPYGSKTQLIVPAEALGRTSTASPGHRSENGS